MIIRLKKSFDMLVKTIEYIDNDWLILYIRDNEAEKAKAYIHYHYDRRIDISIEIPRALATAIIYKRYDIVKLLGTKWRYVINKDLVLVAVISGDPKIVKCIVDLAIRDVISPDSMYFAVISGNTGIFDSVIYSDAVFRDYHINDFKFRRWSPKIIRNFVRAGGWTDALNPHDYSFEITEKRHGHYPALREYMMKRCFRIDTAYPGDIVVHCE